MVFKKDLKKKTRFRYVEVLFQIFYHCSGKENRTLHRELRYKEIRYIEVSLNLFIVALKTVFRRSTV